MFEATVLGINVLIPSIIALLGALLAWSVGKPARGELEAEVDELAGHRPSAALRHVNSVRATAQAAAIGASSVLAIWTAFALRNEWTWWHTDAWMRVPVATALVGLSAIVTASWPTPAWAWLIRGAAVLIAAYATFPTGEAWEFLLPRRYLWLAVIASSTWVGWASLAARSARPAAVLGLSWIALLVGDAYLAGQSFLRVTEPLLAVAAVLGCLSLLSLRIRTSNWLAIASGPCLFATAGFVASAQYNSFLGLPDALTWFAMASPAVAAVATQWLARQADTGGRWGRYVIICVVSCVVLAAVTCGWTTWLLPSGDEEW